VVFSFKFFCLNGLKISILRMRGMGLYKLKQITHTSILRIHLKLGKNKEEKNNKGIHIGEG